MELGPALLPTIAIALSAAFVGGFVARKLRLPPIVGYLLAGIAIGPFTPGLVADAGVASELAEVGVILLMFGVGIHFSPRDLLVVRRTAVPGALVQMAVATLLGLGLGLALGWSAGAGLVFGLAISVSSTVVLLRDFEQQGTLHTRYGRIAVGWLIVQDLLTILVLVLLPVFAPVLTGEGGVSAVTVVGSVGWTLVKAFALVAVLLLVGARVVPWILRQVSGSATGTSEMFTLGVLAIAIGVAYASHAVLGLSFALGAFLAGAVVGESDFSHAAAQEAIPMRDAFASLFFVSVGMLLDPAIIVRMPVAVAATLAIITVGKSLAALAIVLLLKRPLRTGLIVAAGLAQIGEFSFIMASLGGALGVLPEEAFQVIVAAAILSITINPFLLRLADRLSGGPLSRPDSVPVGTRVD
jgi:CPA2 family monovalent cation:H+ antiporter-2